MAIVSERHVSPCQFDGPRMRFSTASPQSDFDTTSRSVVPTKHNRSRRTGDHGVCYRAMPPATETPEIQKPHQDARAPGPSPRSPESACRGARRRRSGLDCHTARRGCLYILQLFCDPVRTPRSPNSRAFWKKGMVSLYCPFLWRAIPCRYAWSNSGYWAETFSGKRTNKLHTIIPMAHLHKTSCPFKANIVIPLFRSQTSS